MDNETVAVLTTKENFSPPVARARISVAADFKSVRGLSIMNTEVSKTCLTNKYMEVVLRNCLCGCEVAKMLRLCLFEKP